MSSFFFMLRKALAWFALLLIPVIVIYNLRGRPPGSMYGFLVMSVLVYVTVRAFSHVRRVRLIAATIDSTTLASRHRRQIEISLPPAEAFELVDAAIRELPYVDNVESTRESMQVYARVKRMDPYLSGKKGRRAAMGASGARKNLIYATVTPDERTATLRLVCEPEAGAWVDWFMVDDGTNYENIEAISRSITRRLSGKRKGEEALVRETATDKELAIAKLNLLHAQVEPHFLYNTLASAQVLTRTDPAKADRMLGNLILYLRTSMPRTDDAKSTLGEELERAQAYLEILKIRLGDRVTSDIQVPEALRRTPMPPMMLQTLVENSIKHGLEPVPGGGTIWILAREIEGRVSITVADDGRGFSEDGGGTGIGLKNVRERLRLAYGDAASFSIVANFPKGVAATITVPSSPRPPQSGDGPGPNSNSNA